MGSRLKGKKRQPEEKVSSWRIHKLVVYAAATLLVMALLWYYYLGE
jgi:hypothetical protein